MAEETGIKMPRMKRIRVGKAPKIARVPDMLGGTRRKARKGRR